MKRVTGRKLIKDLFLVSMLLTAVFFNSCDFSITNPGPVQDQQLENENTFPALVNGMRKSFANAQNWVAYTGAAASKELISGGNTGTFGITFSQRRGKLLPGESNNHWAFAQQARWLANDGIERMKGILGNDFSSSILGAEALLFKGYANRLLGENMCECIIDGGASQDNIVYFELAEAAFTEAIDILININNTVLLNAAYAGRASVRVYLNKWSEAVDDAKKVPIDFVFVSQRTGIKTDEYNRIFWANDNQPYRSHSVHDTYYEDYYTNYNDPRVSWKTDPDYPYGDVGIVPWKYQTKYTSRASPMNLSSGHEMILIRAEAELRLNNWNQALNMINSIRQEVGVADWNASNIEETWTRLKRERGIEMWLEARRLGDLRRWTQGNTPGLMEDMTNRDLCFPISLNEQDSNNNLN